MIVVITKGTKVICEAEEATRRDSIQRINSLRVLEGKTNSRSIGR